MQEPDVFTLDNGLRVVYTHYPHVAGVTVHALGRGGMLYESPEAKGIAHCLEHVVFDGTENYPEQTALDKLIDDVGGSSNGVTSREYVEYYATVLAENAERAFTYVSEIVCHPLLREKDFAREKKIIREEVNSNLSDPGYCTDMNLSKLSYADKRFARPVTGLPDGVAEITPDDIRNFKDKRYVADNFVISICGAISKNEAKALASEYFADLSAGSEAQIPSGKRRAEFQVKTQAWDTAEHSHVRLSYPAPSFNSEAVYATDTGRSVFGSGRLSRLWQTMREKHGLCYSVGTYMSGAPGEGKLTVYTQLDNNNLKKFLDLYNREVEKIASELVSEEEFARDLRQTKAYYRFKSDSTSGTASSYAYNLMFDPDYLSFRSIIDRFDKVTREEVRDEMQKIFSEPPHVSVIGPEPDEGTFREYLE